MQSNNASNKVLVAGATGFVGRVLCRHIAARGFVRALSRTTSTGPWSDHVRVDLGGEADLESALAGIHTVFHLAGLTHDVHGRADEEAYHQVNVEGTRRLVRAAQREGVARLVFLSSVKACGEGSDDAIDELTPPSPSSAYGRSKLAAEQLVLASGIGHTCVLRSSLVYGPGVKGNIARMVRAVRRGKFPPLPQRHNKRSMVHVEDLVTALLLAADQESANGQTFIVTDGQPYSTRDIYEWVVREVGKQVPSWHVPWLVLLAMAKAGDLAGRLSGRAMPIDSTSLHKLMGSSWFRSCRASEDLGFEPAYTLEMAMPDIVRSLA